MTDSKNGTISTKYIKFVDFYGAIFDKLVTTCKWRNEAAKIRENFKNWQRKHLSNVNNETISQRYAYLFIMFVTLIH